jgi:hypothetical protein
MHRRKRKIGIAIEKLFARALPLDRAIKSIVSVVKIQEERTRHPATTP